MKTKLFCFIFLIISSITTGMHLFDDISKYHFLSFIDVQDSSDTVYFYAVEEAPTPIGGVEVIQKNIVYPQTAKESGIQGKVIIKSFIDENGNVVKTEILKGIGGGCDEAAENAIKILKFNPGRQRGKPVKSILIIPIYFQLSEEEKNLAYQIALDQQPTPIGGIEEILKYIIYPEKAKKEGLQGKVYIKAYIDEKGNVIKTEILKGIGGGCDEAAENAVKQTKFTAGIQGGKPVKSQVVVPVLFKLGN